ncbi:MAG: site-specific integrase [Cyanobacteria bacterium P01_A01_bin.17]
MGFNLQYLKPVSGKNGITYHYRRRVPKHVQERVCKREFKKSLGTDRSAAIAKYLIFDEKVELEIRRAEREASGLSSENATHLTKLQRYKATERELLELGENPNFNPKDVGMDVPDDNSEHIKLPNGRGIWIDHGKMAEAEHRSRLAEEMLAQYPVNPETGEPEGVPLDQLAVILALNNGLGKAPSPTLGDALDLYLKEKVSGTARNVNKMSQRVEKVFRLAAEALKIDIYEFRLADLRRVHAKALRDYLLERGIKPSSVKRDISSIKAAINHALVELDHTHLANPFNKLPIPLDNAPNNDRLPFPSDVLRQIDALIDEKANLEVKLIWKMLKGTGCRPSEIRGLRPSDVDLESDVPFIFVRWHEGRRVKNITYSTRYVPLLGDALEAAREALHKTADSESLFPAYFDERGIDRLSTDLRTKFVRKVTQDPKHVPYSLRHNFKDWLDEAGVSEYHRDCIQGWARQGMGNKVYGSENNKKLLPQLAQEMAKVASMLGWSS